MSVNAAHLLDHETMSGKPDLSLHTLSHFLDRFIYRTPKTSKGAKGSSIMQPLAGGETADRLVVAGQAPAHVPLNSEAFWKKKADEVAAEDVFFHEYFNRVGKDKEKSKTRSKKDDKDPVARDEEDAEGLSDNESEIWKALVDSRPELEDGDSDDDLDMDDLESAYDAEENEDGEGSGDEGVIFNDESDKSDEEEEPADEDMSEPEPEPTPKTKTKESKKKDEEPSDEDDDFDMDVSDEDAFVGSDEELPMDMGAFGDEDEEEEPAKDKDEGQQSERKKRRKLKHLPTFASAEDYAELLAGEDEGI